MKETGLPALTIGGKRPFTLASESDRVAARLKQKLDITLGVFLAELRACSVSVSYYGVWCFVSRSGLSFLETLHASEQNCLDGVRRRERWRKHQDNLNSKHLAFIDKPR